MRKQGCGDMRKYPSWKDLQKIAKAGRYAAGDGLYLQVALGGTRSWIFRYRTGDKSFHLGLGSCRYLSLPEARQRAIDLQRQRLSGLDPMEEKRNAKRPAPRPTPPSITFREAALRFITEREASWRNGESAYQWRRSLENYVFPTFGNESVANVTTQYVLTALQPIWATIPETARRVRNRIELIMSYAIAHGWHVGNNPAAWQILKNLLPDLNVKGEKRHHAAVPYPEVPALMARLRQDDSIGSKALQLTILTAARPGEACGARWDEFEADVWTVPAARMKRNRPHRVPLSDAAQALLASVPRENDVVFPSTKAPHIITPTMIGLLRNLGRTETVHGFRSAFSTWASECTRHPDHVVELYLAHQIGSQVERAYRRGDLLDQRRRLMQDWADFCDRLHAEGAHE
jgi:integrase